MLYWYPGRLVTCKACGERYQFAIDSGYPIACSDDCLRALAAIEAAQSLIAPYDPRFNREDRVRLSVENSVRFRKEVLHGK